MDEEQILDVLTAIHSFCASMTEQDFIIHIGHKSTWDKVTRESIAPNVYDLLSYGDMQTRRNLANWLKVKVENS